jgi:hypothetical protein
MGTPFYLAGVNPELTFIALINERPAVLKVEKLYQLA